MAVKPIVLPITYKSDPKGLRAAEKQLKGFANGIKNTVAGATLAVAGIGAASVKAFADFDQAMTQSLAIMGDVSDTLRNDMSDAAREVAKTTTFSAEQAAESYYFLASAGLDAAASVQAMPKVAAFAQAGMFDMALATDLLTDAQSALGLTVDDTAANTENMVRVSDVLVKANTLANASVQQFSEALTNKAGAAMKSVGMDIEEGVAVLAAFADQGVKGVDAGTKFSIVLRDLQSKAIENADAFKRAGIEVFDASGELNNMGDIIANVEDRLGGMSDEQKKVELSTLGFTDKSVSALLALMGTSEAIKEYEQGLRDAGGTTEEVANKQLESLKAQFDLLKSAVIDVGISIGEELEPVFKTLVEEISPVVGEIGDALVPAFREVIVFVQDIAKQLPALIQAFIPLLPVMTQIATLVFGIIAQLLPSFVAILNVLVPIIESWTNYMSRNVETVTAVLVGLGSLVVMIKSFNAVVNLAKLAMVAYNAVLAMNPIGLIVLAVAALTAGLVYFFSQTELGKEIWAGFVSFFQAVVSGMVIAWTDLTQNFGEKWAEFVAGIQAGWEAFLGIFVAVGEGMAIAFSSLGEQLMAGFAAVGEFFTGIWEAFAGFFTEAWETAKEGFMLGLEAIGTFFKNMVNGWIGLFEGFVNNIIGGVNRMIDALNTISIKVPKGVPKIGGITFGVNLPRVPSVNLPRLAEGGIVPATPGGIIANIGEGRYNEAVIPLKPGMGLGNTYNITVNAGMGTSGSRVGEEIIRHIKQYERSSGPVFARA